MKADASITMIDNAARKNRITMDNKAKRNELEQEQKKHDQLGQTPAQPVITEPDKNQLTEQKKDSQLNQLPV